MAVYIEFFGEVLVTGVGRGVRDESEIYVCDEVCEGAKSEVGGIIVMINISKIKLM